MRIQILLMLYAVAMACLVPAFGQQPGAAKTETAATAKTSRFAKLRLGTKDAKLLVFAFDEANGPEAGYDTLRVFPVNFAATAQTIARKTEAREPGRTGRKSGKSSFGPFPLDEFLKAAEIPTDNDKPVVVAASFSEILLDTEEKIKYLEAMLAIAKQSPEKAIQMEAKGDTFLSQHLGQIHPLGQRCRRSLGIHRHPAAGSRHDPNLRRPARPDRQTRTRAVCRCRGRKTLHRRHRRTKPEIPP